MSIISASRARSQTTGQNKVDAEKAREILSSISIGVEKQAARGYYTYSTSWSSNKGTCDLVTKELQDLGYSFSLDDVGALESEDLHGSKIKFYFKITVTWEQVELPTTPTLRSAQQAVSRTVTPWNEGLEEDLTHCLSNLDDKIGKAAQAGLTSCLTMTSVPVELHFVFMSRVTNLGYNVAPLGEPEYHSDFGTVGRMYLVSWA